MGYCFKTDDPVGDAERYIAEQDAMYEEWLEMRPKCKVCEEPIEDEIAVEWEDGYICDCKDCRKQLAEWLLDDYVDEHYELVKES